MANKRIPELDPVVTAAQSDKFIVRQSGDVEDKHVDMDVMQLALLLTESQITDLQSYLLVEVNDLTAAVVWADIPDANVPESAVTQHVAAIDHDSLLNFDAAEHFTQAAISITASQVSDFDTEVGNNAAVAANTAKVTNATHTGQVTGSGALALDVSAITGQTELAAGLASTDELLVNDGGALSRMDVSVIEAYMQANLSFLTSFTEVNDLTAAVVWANVPDLNITESSVTQHEGAIDHDALANFLASEHFTQAAISITESQISDLQAYLLNVVEDTTPQLGGDLDTDGKNIVNNDGTVIGLAITAGTTTGGGTLDGGDLNLTGGVSGTTVLGDGGDVNITGGASDTSSGANKGGDVFVKGGSAIGAGASVGGDVLQQVGLGASSGNSGNYFVNTLTGLGASAGLQVAAGAGLTSIYGVGRSGSGPAGNLELWGGYASGPSSGDDGGDAIMWGGGQGGGAGKGGNAMLIGGEGDSIPGEAKVIGGQATVAGPGGLASVTGGAGFGAGNSPGGSVGLIGGAGSGTGGGGPVFVRGGVGASGSPAKGGDVFIIGGQSLFLNQDGGAVRIEGGTPNGIGDFGDIVLDVGGTNIVYDAVTDRLIQGAEIFAYQSELPAAFTGTLFADINTATPPSNEAVTVGLEFVDLAGDDILADLGFLASNTLQLRNAMRNGNLQFVTQTAVSGTPGKIGLNAGSNTNGVGGNIEVFAGAGGGATGGGGQLFMQAGTAASTNGNGGQALFQSGGGSGVNAGGLTKILAGPGGATSGIGGEIQVTAGVGGGTGAGGQLILAAGTGGATSGAGGKLTLLSGVPINGKGGDILIKAANSLLGNDEGGDIDIFCGDGSGTANGGDLNLGAGQGGPSGTGPGGNVSVNAGGGVGVGAPGGVANVRSGGATNGAGGLVNIIAANGNINGDGGDVKLTSGIGAGTGVDGDIVFVVPGATDILFEAATGRLEQGAETFAYQSEIPSGGLVVNSSHVQTGAVATGTTTIPIDDTIPQITEGDEFMTLSHTPLNAANLLNITIGVYVESLSRISVALFKDAVADSLGAVNHRGDDGDPKFVYFSVQVVAGTTSAITFRVRAGSTGGTTTFNGIGGVRVFGGLMASSITIEEITP